MITKFSALYTGHIRLENVGRDGTPADERRYPNERLAEAFWIARDAARLMDELGYHCLWTAEHHFQREGYECFHRGKRYTIPPPVPYRGYELAEVTVVPRPVHRPVEIWQPIVSGRTLPSLARRGFKGMVTLNGELIFDQVARAFQAEAAKAGRALELGEDLCWGVGLYLADTVEEAIRRLELYHDERYKWFAPFGFVRYADEQGRRWGTPGAPARMPTLRDGVTQRAWLCGPPEHVIGLIREFEERYPGLDQLMIHWAEGMPPEEFAGQLRWFARDVMPAFAGRGATVAAS